MTEINETGQVPDKNYGRLDQVYRQFGLIKTGARVNLWPHVLTDRKMD